MNKNGERCLGGQKMEHLGLLKADNDGINGAGHQSTSFLRYRKLYTFECP